LRRYCKKGNGGGAPKETLSISKGPKIPHLAEFARKSAIVA
jgi:hypothetical protein